MRVHIVLGAPIESAESLKLDQTENDLIVGVDRGGLHVKEAGYRLDIAIGDFDSISEEDMAEINRYADKRVEKTDQENTDFEYALEYVANMLMADEVIIYNWHGGRFDHLISIFYVVYQDRFDQVLPKLYFTDRNNTVSFYKPGHHSLAKEKEKKYVSFITLEKVVDLTLSGVKYGLENEDVEGPKAFISNEFIEGEMNFSFSQGLLMVVQSKD